MPNKSGKVSKSGYDVIVVGAGIVGSYLARRIAEGKHSVLLIDKRSKESLGSWKNSGHNLDKNVFSKLPITPPTEPELGASVDYAYFSSPAKSFEFPLPMHNVKLGPFTIRMVEDAHRAGVEFADKTECVGAIVNKNRVEGVKATHNGEEISYMANIVVDVSGVIGAVKSSLPDEFGIDKSLTPKDYLNVHAEDHEVDESHWPPPFTYHADLQGWSGARRKNVIGLGVGRFAFTGEDPSVACRDIVSRVITFPSKKIFQTEARVPVRHPLHKLVGNGVLMLGDVAFQGKPLNGEGLSVMLYAAEIAAKTINTALAGKDFSETALWPYAVEYMRDWGARFAPFHRMRYELLRFSKAEQKFMVGLGMYGPHEMSSIMLDGKLEMNGTALKNAAKAGLRAIARPDLVIRLARASLDGRKLQKHYAEYPMTAKYLSEWIDAVDALYHHD